MKIQQHPRMKDIAIGDEVMCYRTNLYARVEEVFPAAVCVRLSVVRNVRGRFALAQYPQLWRAEDIENLSVCRYCGSRDELELEQCTGMPLRACAMCRSILALSLADELAETLPAN